jgi:hypothetical protein
MHPRAMIAEIEDGNEHSKRDPCWRGGPVRSRTIARAARQAEDVRFFRFDAGCVGNHDPCVGQLDLCRW